MKGINERINKHTKVSTVLIGAAEHTGYLESENSRVK